MRIKNIDLITYSKDKTAGLYMVDGKKLWLSFEKMTGEGDGYVEFADEYVNYKLGAVNDNGVGVYDLSEFKARETEKAVLYEVPAEAGNGAEEKDIVLKVWAPKSVIKNGKVPAWVVDKAIENAKVYYGSSVFVQLVVNNKQVNK